MAPKRRPHREVGISTTVQEEAAPGVFISFRNADASVLQFAGRPLKSYLEESGLRWVVRLQSFLERVDISSLVRSYKGVGRPPFHPRLILGLILYGMLVRRWSLRELEVLARSDLSAVFLTGGLQPDHSAIAEFFDRHIHAFTEEFFVSVTQMIVRELHMEPVFAAGDGTVIEAAGSRFRALRQSALQQHQREAAEALAKEPSDPKAQGRLDRSTKALTIATARTAERRAKDRKAPEASVVPHEPDAVVQPRKDGAIRPAYKPSIEVHPTRLIVGQHVDPSSETAALEPLLSQHHASFNAGPSVQLLDAGYHTISVLTWWRDHEQGEVLTPSGKTVGKKDWSKASRSSLHPKKAFVYRPESDSYVCPAGESLVPIARDRDRKGQRFQRYGTASCGSCPQRALCTRSKSGREVRRYEGESLKERAEERLKDPANRSLYRRRQGVVEPVFSVLREQQGLTRFHRRGLRKVRAEFGLHCIAYDLHRAVQLLWPYDPTKRPTAVPESHVDHWLVGQCGALNAA